MEKLNSKPNIILVVVDTLRKSFLGCYGNKKIITPNIDRFASESIIFDNAYPEALPTIPVRRALHTGLRTFPFKNYRPLKWDVVNLPGWQPVSNDESTLSEDLAYSGYHTGFVTDTMPYFSPGYNFTRGFLQWEFIRGKEMDKWKSLASVPKSALLKYGDPDEIFIKGQDRIILDQTIEGGIPDESLVSSQNNNLILRHAANTHKIKSEDETSTAIVFKWAMDFVNDNYNLQPFFLLIDSFAPHEPWEVPKKYYEKYANPEYAGKTIIFPDYRSVDNYLTDNQVEDIKANYSGLVTMVDTWFGYFLDKLKKLNIYDNSMIIFLSDHGTNFTDNPERIIGKPSRWLYPGVMDIPMIMHLPSHGNKNKRIRKLVYNIDSIATIYNYLKISPVSKSLGGQNLLSIITDSSWKDREFLTSRYSNTLWYRDKKYWAFMDLEGSLISVFDIVKDPSFLNDISKELDKNTIEGFWKNILKDAGGEIPDYRKIKQTDAIGR